MLMTIDVGNTNITIGVFDGENVLANFRLVTKMERTSDEMGIGMRQMLQANGIGFEAIEGIIIASVVPKVMHALQNACIKYFNIKPVIVGPGVKTGIKIVTPEPNQIGADRIVDAAAAYTLYGGPCLVLDFGTATTYDLVSEDGALLAAATGDELEDEQRKDLYEASILGGLAINSTGTCFPHNVGYYLTENYGVPHGFASAAFLPAMLECVRRDSAEVAWPFYTEIGIGEDAYIALVEACLPDFDFRMTGAQIDAALPRWQNNGSVQNTLADVSVDYIRQMLVSMFV